MTFTRENLAWAAGLFEGEGCFTYHKQSRVISAIVVSTDRDVLEQFQSVVGFGAIYGPYANSKSHWKPKYRWTVSSFEQTQALVALLWPWLQSRRRAKAKEVLRSYIADIPSSFHETQQRAGKIKAALKAIEGRPRGNRWTTGPTQRSIALELGVSEALVNYYAKEIRG